VSLAVAGCGSDSDTATGAGEATGGEGSEATQVPSGAPIKIAVINDATQQGGLGRPEIPAAAEARVEAVNAAGGIDGRPLELIACDAKQDPNAARACARQVVEEGAVAVVGSQTNAEETVYPILEQAGLAAIGTTPTTPVAGESKIDFCFNPGVAGVFLAPVAALQSDGATKVSMIYPSNVGPASELAKTSFEKGVESTGVEDGGLAGYNFGDTQFDAQVVKATANGVNGVFAYAPGSSQAPLVQAMRQQAPDVGVATISASLTPDVLETLGATGDGVLAASFTQPATATELPGIEQFNADMDEYAPEAARTDLAITAWAAVRAFEQVAAELPSVTRSGVLKAMNEVEGLDLGGILPPLSVANRPTDVPGLTCALNTGVVFTKIEDGDLFALEPGEFYYPFGN
jgi:ABC-type branched-subunit amino acid transport system substrate-binding protein